MTFSRGKGVREQYNFSVRPSICPWHYLILNHWAEFNQICYMTSYHCKGVREQVDPYVGILRWRDIDSLLGKSFSYMF